MFDTFIEIVSDLNSLSRYFSPDYTVLLYFIKLSFNIIASLHVKTKKMCLSSEEADSHIYFSCSIYSRERINFFMLSKKIDKRKEKLIAIAFRRANERQPLIQEA